MGGNKVICQLKNDLYFYFYQCLFFAWYKNVFINVFKKTWSLFFTYYEIEQGQTSVNWKNNEHINESASYFPIFLYFEKKFSLMETLIELSPWHSSGTRKFYTEIYLLWNLNTSLTASEVKMIFWPWQTSLYLMLKVEIKLYLVNESILFHICDITKIKISPLSSAPDIFLSLCHLSINLSVCLSIYLSIYHLFIFHHNLSTFLTMHCVHCSYLYILCLLST